MSPHAGADNRDLADLVLVFEAGSPFLGQRSQHGQGGLEFVGQHRKADGRSSVAAHVLDDHIDHDVAVGDGGEDAMADTGAVGDANEGDPGLVLEQGGPADDHLAHPVGLGNDPRPLGVTEAAAHHDRHVELPAKLDAARVHDAGAEASQLQHLVVADGVHLAGFGHDARVGGVDAIDVGVDLAIDVGQDSNPACLRGRIGILPHVAGVVFHHGGEGDGGGIGAAPAQGGDVEVLIDALEAGHDDDLSLVEGLAHPGGGDALDACLGVGAVGDDADLGAGKADGLLAQGLDGHGQESDGDLLAGGQEHVHLAGRRVLGDLAGQLDQLVGGVAAGADDDDDLMAFAFGADGPAGRRHDALRGRHAGAAEFLHDQTHR